MRRLAPSPVRPQKERGGAVVRRHEEAVIPARQQAGDRAGRVPAEPVGDQPLAGLGLAQISADVPSEVNEGAHTRPYTGIAAPWITSASGEQRKRMTLAMASGLGHRL